MQLPAVEAAEAVDAGVVEAGEAAEAAEAAWAAAEAAAAAGVGGGAEAGEDVAAARPGELVAGARLTQMRRPRVGMTGVERFGGHLRG